MKTPAVEMIGADCLSKTLWSSDELSFALGVHSCSLWRVVARYGLRRRAKYIRLPGYIRTGVNGEGYFTKTMRRQSLYCFDQRYDLNGPSRQVRLMWKVQTAIDNPEVLDELVRSLLDRFSVK